MFERVWVDAYIMRKYVWLLDVDIGWTMHKYTTRDDRMPAQHKYK